MLDYQQLINLQSRGTESSNMYLNRYMSSKINRFMHQVICNYDMADQMVFTGANQDQLKVRIIASNSKK